MIKHIDIKTLSTDIVKEMTNACEKKAKELNVPVVISFVDAGANLISMFRMENAFITSIDIANNKAYTACALKQPTNEIADVVLPGQSLYGLQLTNNQRIVPFGGGYPIVVDNQVIGAVGVSGGTVEEDMAIASEALEVFSK